LLPNVLQIFSFFCEVLIYFGITILISVHILIQWNIQASVALAAMEANQIASVYLGEISMCRQMSATT
jgi:hypothetical protein